MDDIKDFFFGWIPDKVSCKVSYEKSCKKTGESTEIKAGVEFDKAAKSIKCECKVKKKE